MTDKHVFTPEETAKGVSTSLRSRKANANLMKKLAKIDFEKVIVEHGLDLIKVFISTPYGSLVTGFILINLATRAGLLTNPNQLAWWALDTSDQTILKDAAIITALFQGLGGGQGIASLVGGLIPKVASAGA